MNKKDSALAGILVSALAVAGAQGALLNLSWSDTDPNVQTLDLQPGETANLYVWVLDLTFDEFVVDNVDTVYFEYEDAPVEVIGTGVAQPEWAYTNNPGIMGVPGVQFAAASASPNDGYQLHATDSSDWLIGHHAIQLQDGVFDGVGDYGTMVPITIYGESDLFYVGLYAYDGTSVSRYAYNPSYASASTGIGTYTGYYAFGTGSPNVPATKAHPGQTENPLWIRVVPEPGGLLWLGLGGLAVVRRRRGR